jgi:hypothetical protein
MMQRKFNLMNFKPGKQIQTSFNTKNNYKLISIRFLTALLILLPMLIYSLFVIHFSVNIPLSDDYETILVPFVFNDGGRYGLFAQHNEHRIVLTRSFSKALFLIIGEIKFTYLIVIGNAALFCLVTVFLIAFKKSALPYIFFIPIVWMMFSLYSWENITWATGSIQNFYILLFSFMAFFLWTQKDIWRCCLSIIPAILAVFTSGNGLLVFGVLIIWEVLSLYSGPRISGNEQLSTHTRPGDKFGKWFPIVLLFVVMILVSCVYFHNYLSPPHHPSVSESLLNPLHTLHFFILLPGAFMQTAGSRTVFFTGMVITAIILLLFLNRLDRKNPAAFCFLLFLVISSFLTALTRSSFGLEHALSSRYQIMSIMIAIPVYWGINYVKASNNVVKNHSNSGDPDRRMYSWNINSWIFEPIIRQEKCSDIRTG